MKLFEIQVGAIVAHYKHNPEIDLVNYTYEIITIAKHSETEELMVVYKPLYQSAWLENAQCAVRPLKMFCENVEYNGQEVERFRLIS